MNREDAKGEAEGELVFVYGTLRRGASNEFRMEGAEFEGRATVRGRLYRIDWYPGLVLDREAGEVVGEVFEVSPELLGALDEFEGEEYRRVKAEVMREEPYFRQEVWMWEFRGEVDGKVQVPGGDWVEGMRPVVLPLFLWVAWSPFVLFVALIVVQMITGDVVFPDVPAWAVLVAGATVPTVMAGGGIMATRRGERPRLLGYAATTLGVTGMVFLGWLFLVLFWM